MSREIKKLYENQKNAHEIIDYLNDIIKDLDVDIISKNEKGVQAVIPLICIKNDNPKDLIRCKQKTDSDEILIIIRPEFSSKRTTDYKKFTFKSLDELKAFSIKFDSRIREKYEELCRDSVKKAKEKEKLLNAEPKQKENSESIEEKYMRLLAKLEHSFDETSQTEKDTSVKRRIGQSILRKELIAKKCECKICKMADEKFLIASHIKPWSESNDYERLDSNNAFLMCPNHDSLFDKGYITFDESGKIMISKRISDDNKILLNIHDDMKIEIEEENKKYLEWHRNNLFK